MPGGILHDPLAARSSASLVARGGLARTFGSLVGFLAMSFLCSGIYILEDAFADPIHAGAAALISGAFIITLAFILLFYLVKPGKRSRPHYHPRLPLAAAGAGPLLYAAPDASRHDDLRHDDLRNDLVYQRFYVDHFRIRS